MSKTVQCKKLGKIAPALAKPPFPGDLGTKIYNNISQPAWDAWLIEQTKIINELRLNVTEPTARELLEKKMLEFLFVEI